LRCCYTSRNINCWKNLHNTSDLTKCCCSSCCRNIIIIIMTVKLCFLHCVSFKGVAIVLHYLLLALKNLTLYSLKCVSSRMVLIYIIYFRVPCPACGRWDSPAKYNAVIYCCYIQKQKLTQPDHELSFFLNFRIEIETFLMDVREESWMI